MILIVFSTKKNGGALVSDNYYSESEKLVQELLGKMRDGSLSELDLVSIGRQLYDLGYSSGWETGDNYIQDCKKGLY